MKCAACHGQMQTKRGEIELRIHGKLYLVENVTFQECSLCGERVLSPQVSQEIFAKIQSHSYKERQMYLPVVECGTV